MKAYKETKTEYYKYRNADFVQPILTANGTLDGNSFAVDGRQYSSDAMYKAFDGNASTFWETYNYALVDTCYICNDIPINISEIKLTLSENKGWTQIVISGSNDNVDYFEEQTIATVNSSNLDTFACSFEGYYKYYKITYTNRYTSARGYYARITNIDITAQTRFTVDGTVDDYDYTEDVEVFSLPAVKFETDVDKYTTLATLPTYANAQEGLEGINGISFSPADMYFCVGKDEVSTVENSLDYKVVWQFGDGVEFLMSSYTYTGYVDTNDIPKANLQYIEASDDGVVWETVTIPDTRYRKYYRFTFAGSEVNRYSTMGMKYFNFTGTLKKMVNETVTQYYGIVG